MYKNFSDDAIFTKNKFHRYYSRGFRLEAFKSAAKYFLDTFTDHVEMVNKPTHISRFLIDYFYIKKALIEEFSHKFNC